MYVHSVNGTTVEIRTYGGEMPTKWEYVAGDSIFIYKDIFLFSNPRPLINDEGIAYGYETSSGTLYRVDQNDYGEVVDKIYNGIYRNVEVSIWNNSYNAINFVKGTNLLYLTNTDYEIVKSQNINLENPNNQSILKIYDIDVEGSSIYKLQIGIMQRTDNGEYYEVSWSTYNYHYDTTIPYLNSIH